MGRINRSVGKSAAGLRRWGKSWFRVPSGPMTIFFIFPKLLRVLKWALLYNEKRGLTTTVTPPLLGHAPLRKEEIGRSVG
jgi:hypothetical protein